MSCCTVLYYTILYYFIHLLLISLLITHLLSPIIILTTGVWQEMLEIITILSVIYNFGLLFFTSHYLQDISWEYRWILFIIAEHFMFAIKYVLSFSIEDSPEDVLIQLERYVRTYFRIFFFV